MQRNPVLGLLREHLVVCQDAHEKEMCAAIIAFVEAHPDCFLRSCLSGHLTGSAWITDPSRTRVLLTHHRKLDKWLQLGGHADGESNLLEVALKEAREESGLTQFRVVSEKPFDVDRHEIPERKGVPAHWHLDLRFHLEADPSLPLLISDESHDLAWVPLSEVPRLNPEASMLRMVTKMSAARTTKL